MQSGRVLHISQFPLTAASGTRGNGADSSSAQRINSTSAEDISPAVSVFVGLAAGALYENDLVRNAHRNTDGESLPNLLKQMPKRIGEITSR